MVRKKSSKRKRVTSRTRDSRRTTTSKSRIPAKLGTFPKPESPSSGLSVKPHTKDFKRYGKNVPFKTDGKIYWSKIDADNRAKMIKTQQVYAMTVAVKVVKLPRVGKNNRDGWVVYSRHVPWPKKSGARS